MIMDSQVCCCPYLEFTPEEECEDFVYFRVDVEDISREPIELYFEEAVTFIDRFVATPFSHDERHVRRIGQIAAFEADGSLLPDPRADEAAPDVLAADDSSFDPEAG